MIFDETLDKQVDLSIVRSYWQDHSKQIEMDLRHASLYEPKDRKTAEKIREMFAQQYPQYTVDIKMDSWVWYVFINPHIPGVHELMIQL
jgi:hypothetical protein